jgi:hypothetical protein
VAMVTAAEVEPVSLPPLCRVGTYSRKKLWVMARRSCASGRDGS